MVILDRKARWAEGMLQQKLSWALCRSVYTVMYSMVYTHVNTRRPRVQEGLGMGHGVSDPGMCLDNHPPPVDYLSSTMPAQV